MQTEAHLRVAGLADEAALFDICRRTVDMGDDASGDFSHAKLAGYVWAVPHLHFSPEQCFVVARGDAVLGYIVSVSDTKAFEVWQKANWWPKVRRELLGFMAQTDWDREVMANVDEPEVTPEALALAYPAHLHINLLPEARGAGWGRKLIEAACDAVRRQGAQAMHLGVSLKNPNAVEFYRHLGFEDIGPEEEDADGLTLGKTLG